MIAEPCCIAFSAPRCSAQATLRLARLPFMARQRIPSRTPDTPVDDADAALFRAAIGPVRELPAGEAPPATPRPKPSTRMAERDDDEARSEFARMLQADRLEAGDTLSYRRDEVPVTLFNRLRRGQYAAEDELDLHGQQAAAATTLMRAFLRNAVDGKFGCVRIVHGKGYGSGERIPVLKNLVDRLLRQRADVLAFHSAPAAQGGTGAVLVLLRRRKR